VVPPLLLPLLLPPLVLLPELHAATTASKNAKDAAITNPRILMPVD
jgi:hypothetical protein